MFMTGVHMPSTPASSMAGCNTLVGQTRMHWPHLTHRSRNSGSATEPGGRMTSFLKFFVISPLAREKEKKKRPVSPAKITRRRLRSGAATSREEGGSMLKPSAPWGQSSRQLKQTRHSDLRRADCGSEAPWQRWRQSLQLSHFCSSRSIRQRETREKNPSVAPRGHRTRQK